MIYTLKNVTFMYNRPFLHELTYSSHKDSCNNKQRLNSY